MYRRRVRKCCPWEPEDSVRLSERASAPAGVVGALVVCRLPMLHWLSASLWEVDDSVEVGDTDFEVVVELNPTRCAGEVTGASNNRVVTPSGRLGPVRIDGGYELISSV